MKLKNRKSSKNFHKTLTAATGFIAVFCLMVAFLIPKSFASTSDQPTLSISNSKMLEGDSGTRVMKFDVTLSAPSASTVTVGYYTQSLGGVEHAVGVKSATVTGGDYVNKSGYLTFSAGQVQKTILITIIGDTTSEIDESFSINLHDVVGATFMDQYGTGTILNDDGSSGLKLGISDASIRTSKSGTRTVDMNVILSAPAATDFTITYKTNPGSAIGVKSITTTGGDYVTQNKTVNITAGTVTKAFSIVIFPNTSVEGTKTFTVSLTSTLGTVVRNTGTVIIRDPNATYNRIGRNAGPARVSLMGDSITYNYEFVTKEVLENKGYSVFLDGQPGTGILDAAKCNGQWSNQMLTAEDPDVVVFENIGNYQNGNIACSPVVTFASPEFYSQWQNEAQLDTNILISKGAQVFWIINPAAINTSHPTYPTSIATINSIYSSIASTTPNTHTIDAWNPFGGYPPDCSLRVIEYPDICLHLNPAGESLMSSLVTTAIAPYIP